MTIFVDDAAIMYRSKPCFHMIADSVVELHAFCQQIGINRCWFHNVRGRPHYDITGLQRDLAILAGAIAVSSEELALRTEAGQRTLKRLLERSKDDPLEVARLQQYLRPHTSTEPAPGDTRQLF
ncbi:DUF4031 domain-containing protein [Pseudomonas serbica]|uniref:DUF4031 domain-containing protein n=1 Tax=Pseudomonas serbica TaxID=2965074 RepID=UPI00237A7915|nr:DUF4031 domain-containing protein [Pseudomonas serbica]